MTSTNTATSDPIRSCDVVMKGGITSGVVYPRALTELAEVYRFRNIGGTSAGAIAAAAAAVAELGRGKAGAGFDRLKTLPDRLVDNERLFTLFQPQDGTANLFALATAGMGRANMLVKIARMLGAIVSGYFPWLVGGALPGAVLTVLVSRLPSAKALGFSMSILTLIVGVVVSLALGIFLDVVRKVPANNFGLCKGFDANESTWRPGLISW